MPKGAAPRVLSASLVQSEPYQVWNAFVDLLATVDYKALNEVQRIPHLCFWYDSEVLNGGHLQYFENHVVQGNTRVGEAIEALRLLGATSQAEILERAEKIRVSKPRRMIETVEEYVEREREGEFDDLDSAYYEVSPSVGDLLAKYLDAHLDQFVIVR